MNVKLFIEQRQSLLSISKVLVFPNKVMECILS